MRKSANYARSCVLNLFMTLIIMLSCSASYAEKTITIATEEYPPYASEHLQYFGVDCRIVTEAFRLEGIRVIYKFYPAVRSYYLAEKGVVEGTLPWAKRVDRESLFYFTDPMIESDIEHLYYLKTTEVKWDPRTQDYSAL